jgi:hypothetical protein
MLPVSGAEADAIRGYRDDGYMIDWCAHPVFLPEACTVDAVSGKCAIPKL